jgi:hypothetical protein
LGVVDFAKSSAARGVGAVGHLIRHSPGHDRPIRPLGCQYQVNAGRPTFSGQSSDHLFEIPLFVAPQRDKVAALRLLRKLLGRVPRSSSGCSRIIFGLIEVERAMRRQHRNERARHILKLIFL